MTNETILILADGDWSHERTIRPLVESADRVLAADGGGSKAIARGIRVDELIGDLDSIPHADREALLAAQTPVVHAFPREKDWTDLELAIDHALRRNPRRIHLFGVFGPRLDHTLTAVHLLEKGLQAGVPITLFTGTESARLVAGPHTLDPVRPGDRVSLIPVSPSCTVTTHGLRYALRGEILKRCASRGVSNEVVSLPARIEVSAGLLVIIQAEKEEPRDA